MLFLENPNQRTSVWSFFEKILMGDNNYLVVSKGENKSAILDKASVDIIFNRFKNANIIRLGVKHGNAMHPFFALDFVSDNELFLKEYITYISLDSKHMDKQQIERDVGMLAVVIFFELPKVKKITIPINIGNSINEEYCIVCLGDMLSEITRA